MKNSNIATKLLEGVNLSQSDIARLALKAIESLGDLAQVLDRIELITLLRNTLREGVSAMKAQLSTQSRWRKQAPPPPCRAQNASKRPKSLFVTA